MHFSATLRIFDKWLKTKDGGQSSLYKDYFSEFFFRQRIKVREKISWTIDLLENHERIPQTYLKHLEGTEGLYELRVHHGNDEIRIFCFFDKDQLVILANGFYKKSRVTPKKEIAKALRIKREYFDETSAQV